MNPPFHSAQLKSQLSNLNSQISNLKLQISNLKSQISTLNSQLSTLKSQISTLKSQISTFKSQISTLNSQISTLNSCWVSFFNPTYKFYKFYKFNYYMMTQTAIAPSQKQSPLLFEGLTWREFKAVEQLLDRPGYRLSFLDGVLEISKRFG